MKIQELAIIFIIIILPISLLLSEYTQFQIQTIALQSEYDARLTAATYDAIRAFQLNATNSSTSDLANSKMRDLEASIATFRNSIMTGFELNGYTEEDLNNYIPALVYTLYDGFYIYSPYENTHDESGNRIPGGGDSIYGLKPYINYSCRYKSDNGKIDVVITYALDNNITVQGMMPDETGNIVYVNKSGYLIDGITVNGDTVTYNGVNIQNEHLKESLLGRECSYAKINGTKYYLVKGYTEDGKDCIVYILNGKLIVQYNESDTEFSMWKNKILNNDNAKQYYIKAYEFTKWLREETDLDTLTYANAIDEVIDDHGSTKITKVWGDNNTKIFDFKSGINIENELSDFNQHRLAVIRHKIETNLAIAISNYNSYSGATSNVFQMPELKENEWDNITHSISLISFLQGLHIGGKVYNGYTLVTNSESKEVVIEDNIYILAQDAAGKKAYHKIGDKGFENGTLSVNASQYGDVQSAGRLNLDFEKASVSNNNLAYSYYPLEGYKASYSSVVMQNSVTTYDDIYEYVNTQDDTLKEAFYTALGRERQGKYNRNTIIGESDENAGPYIPKGYTHVSGTTMNNGYVVQDSKGNQFVWVEVPKTSEVYGTAGLNIISFTDAEYSKIEKDLQTYTSVYRNGNGTELTDTWSSEAATGLNESQYNAQKKKMLKSIYKNGGFYVGRYETGIDYSEGPRTTNGNATQTPVIKQNAYPYNYVTHAQSQQLSQSFETEGYTSSLMFGVQRALVVKYLETKGEKQQELVEVTKSWGNVYNNSWNITNASARYSENGTAWTSSAYGQKDDTTPILLSTGASDTFSKQNIYDLVGNVWEATLEYYTVNEEAPCLDRGQCYLDPTGRIMGYNPMVNYLGFNYSGFRTALYKDEGIGADSSTDEPTYIPDGYKHVSGTTINENIH